MDYQVLDTACTAVQTRLVVIKGAGERSLIGLTEIQIREALLLFSVYQPLQFIAVCMARVSVAALLLRILGISAWRRWLCIASTFIVAVVFSIVTFVQCSPTSFFWDANEIGSCWNPAIWRAIAISASGTFAHDTCIIRVVRTDQRQVGMLS